MDYLREIAHSMSFISEPVLEHVANNHSPLLTDQIDDLSKLGIYYLEDNEWHYLDSKVNTGNKTVSADISKLGQYRLFSGADKSLVTHIPDKFNLNCLYNIQRIWNATDLQ